MTSEVTRFRGRTMAERPNDGTNPDRKLSTAIAVGSSPSSTASPLSGNSSDTGTDDVSHEGINDSSPNQSRGNGSSSGGSLQSQWCTLSSQNRSSLSSSVPQSGDGLSDKVSGPRESKVTRCLRSPIDTILQRSCREPCRVRTGYGLNSLSQKHEEHLNRPCRSGSGSTVNL